jgi:hypothetical protein
MKKLGLYVPVLFLLLLLGLIVLQSCSLLERPSATKKHEKIEQELQKQANKEYMEARELHLDRQSEATKKMMKKMERKNKKWLKSKKR